MTTHTLSSTTLTGDPVKNDRGEELGSVEEIMIDIESGRVAYLVMATGGVLGMGEAYFAVPWGMVEVDTEDHAVIVDIDKATVENAPGFDKDNWPEASELSRLIHY